MLGNASFSLPAISKPLFIVLSECFLVLLTDIPIIEIVYILILTSVAPNSYNSLKISFSCDIYCLKFICFGVSIISSCSTDSLDQCLYLLALHFQWIMCKLFLFSLMVYHINIYYCWFSETLLIHFFGVTLLEYDCKICSPLSDGIQFPT